MNVTVKNIEKTILNEQAFIKLIKKYYKSKKDLLVVFDDRLTIFGSYILDKETDVCEIKIGLKKCLFYFNKKKHLSDNDQKCIIITTMLHEIKHANQELDNPKLFNNINYSRNQQLENSTLSEDCSMCELEAREYECKHLLNAIEYYEKIIKEIK